jgi:hypothetical protein
MTAVHTLGPATVIIPREQCRRVLTDLAGHVHADRAGNTNPVYSDDVLLQLIPPFCGDLEPTVAVWLFLLLAEEEHEAGRGDTSYTQVAIAETNARNYLDALLGVRP